MFGGVGAGRIEDFDFYIGFLSSLVFCLLRPQNPLSPKGKAFILICNTPDWIKLIY